MKISIAIGIILNAVVLSVIAYQQREHYTKQTQIQAGATELASKQNETLRKDIEALKLTNGRVTTLDKKIEQLAADTAALQTDLKNLEPINKQTATQSEEIAQLSKDTALFREDLEQLKSALKTIEQLQKTEKDLQEKVIGLTEKIDTAAIAALEKKVEELGRESAARKKSLDSQSAKVLPAKEDDAEKAEVPTTKTGLILPPNTLNTKLTHQDAWRKRRENQAQLISFSKEWTEIKKEMAALGSEIKFATTSKKRALLPRFQIMQARWNNFLVNTDYPELINKCGIKVGDFCFLYLGTSSAKEGFIEKKYRNFAVNYNGNRTPQVLRFQLSADDAFGENAFSGASKVTWKSKDDPTSWTIYSQSLDLFSSTGGPSEKIENAYISEIQLEVIYSD